jgi:hypothetical protein
MSILARCAPERPETLKRAKGSDFEVVETGACSAVRGQPSRLRVGRGCAIGELRLLAVENVPGFLQEPETYPVAGAPELLFAQSD